MREQGNRRRSMMPRKSSCYNAANKLPAGGGAQQSTKHDQKTANKMPTQTAAVNLQLKADTNIEVRHTKSSSLIDLGHQIKSTEKMRKSIQN